MRYKKVEHNNPTSCNISRGLWKHIYCDRWQSNKDMDMKIITKCGSLNKSKWPESWKKCAFVTFVFRGGAGQKLFLFQGRNPSFVLNHDKMCSSFGPTPTNNQREKTHVTIMVTNVKHVISNIYVLF